MQFHFQITHKILYLTVVQLCYGLLLSRTLQFKTKQTILTLLHLKGSPEKPNSYATYGVHKCPLMLRIKIKRQTLLKQNHHKHWPSKFYHFRTANCFQQQIFLLKKQHRPLCYKFVSTLNYQVCLIALVRMRCSVLVGNSFEIVLMERVLHFLQLTELWRNSFTKLEKNLTA